MRGFVAEGNGVGHVVVVVPALTRELEEFATSVLGFELFGGAPAHIGRDGGPRPQFYRCNRRTHCFAYIGIPGMRGVQHICIEANRLDDVGRAYDLAQERNLPITLSLGRHTMDTLVSFYMRTPSGFDIEFGAGGELLNGGQSLTFGSVGSQACLEGLGSDRPACVSLSRGRFGCGQFCCSMR